MNDIMAPSPQHGAELSVSGSIVGLASLSSTSTQGEGAAHDWWGMLDEWRENCRAVIAGADPMGGRVWDCGPVGGKIAHIISAVARYTGVAEAEILSKRRSGHVVRARYIAIHIVRKTTPHSLPEIGRAFNRDHTSIMHALRNIKPLMDHDAGKIMEALYD